LPDEEGGVRRAQRRRHRGSGQERREGVHAAARGAREHAQGSRRQVRDPDAAPAPEHRRRRSREPAEAEPGAARYRAPEAQSEKEGALAQGRLVVAVMLYPVENEYRRLSCLDGVWDFLLDPRDQGVAGEWFLRFPEGASIMPVPSSYNDIGT